MDLTAKLRALESLNSTNALLGNEHAWKDVKKQRDPLFEEIQATNISTDFCVNQIEDIVDSSDDHEASQSEEIRGSIKPPLPPVPQARKLAPIHVASTNGSTNNSDSTHSSKGLGSLGNLVQNLSFFAGNRVPSARK